MCHPLATCDQSARHVVQRAVQALFVRRDRQAAHRFAGPDFRGHSSLSRSTGPEALTELVEALPPGFRYLPHRTLSQDDLVLVEATCHGLAEQPVTSYDLFRVAEGRLAEHWDAYGPVGLLGTAGRTDGRIPSPPGADPTPAVLQFIGNVLIGGRHSEAASLTAPDVRYHRYDPVRGREHAAVPGRDPLVHPSVRYRRLLRCVAQRDTVFSLCRGEVDGADGLLFDLFTVSGGRIQEHRGLAARTERPS